MRGHDDAAAVLWGLAAAMKLFPMVLLILLLPRGKWRAFAVGVGTFVGATMLSLWWLGPSIGVAWQGIAAECVWLPGHAHGRVEPARVGGEPLAD